MTESAITALLLSGMVAPVVLYWLLRSRFKIRGLYSGLAAVTAGWAINIAWALSIQANPSVESVHASDDMLGMAAAFGWFCPAILVLVTWGIWHIVSPRPPD